MASGSRVRSAHKLLDWGHSMVDPALRAAVERLPPQTRRIAGYHMGWFDAHGEPAVNAGGKALRPTLCLLTAAGFAAGPHVALPAAVAVELVHGFSLLHDDVMDGDMRRRHQPAAWTVFGVSPAILVGDAMLTAAFDVLACSDHERALSGLRALSAAVIDLVDGQSLDLQFEQRDDVTLAECQRMAAAKTAALLGCACALGALFAGAPAPQVKQLRAFGEQLGVAFQLIDDMLGIWGDPQITGKPVYSDLASRKNSLPVVAALRSGTRAGAELAHLYGRGDALSAVELSHAAVLVERAGARAWSKAQATKQLARAVEHLQAAALAQPSAGELVELARLVTSRDS
jgi:geranylgeranyl diphosphate synthase, type I